MTASAEIETLYDMITVTSALAINIASFGVAVGAAANMVVLAPDGCRRGVALPQGAVLRCQSRTPR